MRRAALCLALALLAVLLTFSPILAANRQDVPLKVAIVPQKGAQSPEEAKAVEDVPFIRLIGGNTLNIRTAGTVNNYQGSLSPEEREENRKLIRAATEYIHRP